MELLLGFLFPIFIIIISSYFMWIGCKIFSNGSVIVGHRLPQGVTGATINAIGSSLPEFFTSFLFFFILHESSSGMSAALGTVVGSAVFNILIIPAVVITVLIKKKHNLKIQKKIILRDGFILIITQILLLTFMSDGKVNSLEAITLLAVYIIYVIFLFNSGKWKEKNPKITHQKLLKGWKNLIIGCFIAGIASWMCVEACELLSMEEWDTWWTQLFGLNQLTGLGVFEWGTIGVLALLLAAAASSIPDLFISIIDARKGKMADALANPLGSNIFDLCIAFSVPLGLYTIFNNQITLTNDIELLQEIKHFMQLMIVITILFLGSVIIFDKFRKFHVYFFITLFLTFIYFIFNQSILAQIINYL